MKRKVYLVGAGPGDPELLTVKALRILQSADVVLHDELISTEVLAVVPRTALLYNVGKRCGKKNPSQERINSLLVSLASSGLRVVRLKSGDPFVFGRGGEELEALRAAGIEVGVVPGITAAVGAAAATQLPLTHRQFSSTLVFLTNHHAELEMPDDWRPFASSKTTLVIYMPGQNHTALSRKLRDAGFAATIPCAIISRATTPEQQVYSTTAGRLGSAPHLPAPTLVVVGEVVRFADVQEAFATISAEQQSSPLVQQNFSLIKETSRSDPRE